jgi:hypothetical protein
VMVDTEQMADLILEIYVGGGRLEREDASGFVWDDDRARGEICMISSIILMCTLSASTLYFGLPNSL